MSILAGKLFLRPLKIPVDIMKCFVNTCGLIQKQKLIRNQYYLKDLLEQGYRYITDIYENSNELLSYTE